jgi:hypothetical protein
VRSSVWNRLQTALAGLVAIAVAGAVAAVVLSSAVEGTSPECGTWNAEQLDNAAAVMRAGEDLGLSVLDQAIGVMTAMAESSLRNIDYGDWDTSGVRNPDGGPTTSIGLFQQQDGWGSREARLEPYSAATLFYRAMIEEVPDGEREQLEPTLVAHRTQTNANPRHYDRYWAAAVAVVEQLSGAKSGFASGAPC